MAIRTALRLFLLANDAYANAKITAYQVDASGNRLGTLATLYDTPTGGDSAPNPFNLDGDGKLGDPLYHTEALICSIEGIEVPAHDTGVIGVENLWRGSYLSGTIYYAGNVIQDGPTKRVYVATTDFTATTLNADINAGRLDMMIDTAAVSTQTITRHTATGDGTTTAFVMPVTPANTASVIVSVAGADSTAWTLSTNTITFGAAPANGAALVSLFGGAIDWLVEWFPQLDKDQKPTGWFSARGAGRYLVEKCHGAGMFDPDAPSRGIGVWPLAGGVAVHLGDRVLVDGEPRAPGFVADGALWSARPRVPGPAAPCTAQDAREVEGWLGRWRFEQPGAAALMLGFVGSALLGAVTSWRAHLLVVGSPGQGKTTLMEAMQATAPLAMLQNDFTEAGLRQSLNGRAGPLMLDEAEGDRGQKMRAVILMLRRSSGRGGLRGVRGSVAGRSQGFAVNASALMGAVLPPALEPQDATRITRLDLAAAVAGAEPLDVDAMLARLRHLGPGLWGRALAGLPRYQATLAALRDRMVANAASVRQADQVGALLAGYLTLVEDHPIIDGRLDRLLADYDWLMPRPQEVVESSGGWRCLQHLLTASIEYTAHGERKSLGRLLIEARASSSDMVARRVLQDHGVRLMPLPKGDRAPLLEGDTPPAWLDQEGLFVVGRHPRLEKLFEGTNWSEARWRDDLRRLTGAVTCATSQRVAGWKDRGVWLPAPLLPDTRADEDDEGKDAQ